MPSLPRGWPGRAVFLDGAARSHRAMQALEGAQHGGVIEAPDGLRVGDLETAPSLTLSPGHFTRAFAPGQNGPQAGPGAIGEGAIRHFGKGRLEYHPRRISAGRNSASQALVDQ